MKKAAKGERQEKARKRKLEASMLEAMEVMKSMGTSGAANGEQEASIANFVKSEVKSENLGEDKTETPVFGNSGGNKVPVGDANIEYETWNTGTETGTTGNQNHGQRRGNSNNRRGKFHSNKNYLNNAFQQ